MGKALQPYGFLALAALGAALVLYVLVLPHAKAPAPTMESTLATKTLAIGTAAIVAEVADTPALRERGLSGRASLEEGRGMWFVFDEDGLWPFWMKDTLIPLDILWVDAEGTIVTIAHNVQPDSYPQATVSTSPARYVLELPGGYAARHGIAERVAVQQK